MKKFKSYEEAVKNINKVDLSDYSQLSLAREKDGWTVAHELAYSELLPEEYITPEVLMIADTSNNWTVAHELANNKQLPEKLITADILKLSTFNENWTVAHELANKNNLLEKFITYDILKLSMVKGWSVAHELAYKKKLPEKLITDDILKLNSNGSGFTVAHYLANSGKLPKRSATPEILLLSSRNGYVFDYVREYRNITLDTSEDDISLYLVAMTQYNYPKMKFDKFKELTEKHGLDKMKKLIKLSKEKEGNA